MGVGKTYHHRRVAIVHQMITQPLQRPGESTPGESLVDTEHHIRRVNPYHAVEGRNGCVSRTGNEISNPGMKHQAA